MEQHRCPAEGETINEFGERDLCPVQDRSGQPLQLFTAERRLDVQQRYRYQRAAGPLPTDDGPGNALDLRRPLIYAAPPGNSATGQRGGPEGAR